MRLRGYRREETVRFMAFRSHWRFAAEFCTPGEGHEKGGIEGEGGYFRRNHLVTVQRVADFGGQPRLRHGEDQLLLGASACGHTRGSAHPSAACRDFGMPVVRLPATNVATAVASMFSISSITSMC